MSDAFPTFKRKIYPLAKWKTDFQMKKYARFAVFFQPIIDRIKSKNKSENRTISDQQIAYRLQNKNKSQTHTQNRDETFLEKLQKFAQ